MIVVVLLRVCLSHSRMPFGEFFLRRKLERYYVEHGLKSCVARHTNHFKKLIWFNGVMVIRVTWISIARRSTVNAVPIFDLQKAQDKLIENVNSQLPGHLLSNDVGEFDARIAMVSPGIGGLIIPAFFPGMVNR